MERTKARRARSISGQADGGSAPRTTSPAGRTLCIDDRDPGRADQAPRSSLVKIEDVMARRVATVGPEDGLDRAARGMHQRQCGSVIVVDDENHALGVVTDRDVCMAAWRSNSPLSMLTVRDAMSRRLFACRPGDPVARAEQLMDLHQVRRLPVVDDDGRLVGLVALDGIGREAGRAAPLVAPHVSA
jgi:CBS domain-containing protein